MYTGEVTFQNDSIVSMLSRIEAIRGSFPRHMIAQGRQSGRFFTKSGLLYEVVDESDHETRKNPPGPNDSCDESDSDSDTSVLFDIFQPKNTTLASRLGFEADLMDDYDPKRIPPGERDLTDFELEQVFADFVGRLLTIDPDGRPSADEALRHPYMVYASTLTEEMIKYPSN
jgi:serine/threonine protein kinase